MTVCGSRWGGCAGGRTFCCPDDRSPAGSAGSTHIVAVSWKSICIRELRFCTPPKTGIVQKHIYHSISNLHLTARTRFRVKPRMTKGRLEITQESQRFILGLLRSAATQGCPRGSAPSMNEGTGYKKRQACDACLFLYPQPEYYRTLSWKNWNGSGPSGTSFRIRKSKRKTFPAGP